MHVKLANSTNGKDHKHSHINIKLAENTWLSLVSYHMIDYHVVDYHPKLLISGLINNE